MKPHRGSSPDLRAPPQPFWSMPVEAHLEALGSAPEGLSSAQAATLIEQYGPNRVRDDGRAGVLRLIARQFESPLVLILVFGALVAFVLREWLDASIILLIVTASGLLGFYQEHRASRAMARLQARLALRTRVLRDGREAELAVSGLVPGDVVLLSAGDLVPADGVVLESRDFLVSESSLTGESFPIEKRSGVSKPDAAPAERTNAVFMGSSVRSGTARVLIVETGRRTAYGAIAAELGTREPETEFARGVRHFGGMLMRVMLLIVVFVLVVNQFLGRPVIDSLLFAVALAVGLSPELLPAVINVMLSDGAHRLARRGVIVRRLESIENLGSIDILCTDKTGTLTRPEIALEAALDPNAQPSDETLRLGYINAALQTGIENPLDAALVDAGRAARLPDSGFRKIDEIPYDFARRSLSIIVEDPKEAAQHLMIVKGAVDNVLSACTKMRNGRDDVPLDQALRRQIEVEYRKQGEAGFRVLAVAVREFPARPRYTRDDENDLVFVGFLLFQNPAKDDTAAAIADLAALGISVRIISGDNRYVTAHLARTVGLDPTAILTGAEIRNMRDEVLWHAAPRTDLFVEIDPQQKERIVRALQHAGSTVGYMGDGVNDAPALHAADIGISVNEAVDVARESADVVLMERELDVLRQGVESGRRIFNNTLKYISITTSANFGNMLSMALATPFLPFLPLLPKQILLNNFLSDVPLTAIATDNVDADLVAQPHHWDVHQIQRYMVVFGLISSLFDILTFTVLLLVFRVGETTFQTAWFVVSLLTELLVVLSLRTQGSMIRSRPGTLLLAGTLVVAALSFALPYLWGVGAVFGFVPLPLPEMALVAAIATAYVAATELVKRWFYRRRRFDRVAG